jgi:hypothetical protein
MAARTDRVTLPPQVAMRREVSPLRVRGPSRSPLRRLQPAASPTRRRGGGSSAVSPLRRATTAIETGSEVPPPARALSQPKIRRVVVPMR